MREDCAPCRICIEMETLQSTSFVLPSPTINSIGSYWGRWWKVSHLREVVDMTILAWLSIFWGKHILAKLITQWKKLLNVVDNEVQAEREEVELIGSLVKQLSGYRAEPSFTHLWYSSRLYLASVINFTSVSAAEEVFGREGPITSWLKQLPKAGQTLSGSPAYFRR